MNRIASALAVVALLCAGLPAIYPYIGIAIAMFAAVLGFMAFRKKTATGPYRLWGAAAAGLATIALVLCGTRVVLTLLAIERVMRLS